MKSSLKTVSASPQREVASFGVDTALVFVGPRDQLEVVADKHITPWSGHPADVFAGLVATTGLGDGCYPVLEGAGHLLCPEAVLLIEFVPPVVRYTHSDIDGDVSFDDDDYDLATVQVDAEQTFELPDGKLAIVGDPIAGCVDVNLVDVPAGTYVARTLTAELGEPFGRRIVAIAIVAA